VSRPPLFYGWVVVAGAFLVLFTAYGAQYAFGVFFSALLEEFGWSRASLSGVFSLYAFTYSGFGLVAGSLTDRWGPRLVIALGGALLGLGLIGMSATTTLWHPYVLYGLVAALGMSTAYVPCNATVARWFVRRRGLAVGIASAGGSLGTFAFPPVAHYLVSRGGWRWAYVVLGAGTLLTLNLVATLMRRDPESAGLAPDGDQGGPGPGQAGPDRPWTVGRAARSAAFWILFAVFASTWIPVFIPLVHLVPLATGLGISPLLAATLVSALGAAAMLGRLSMGAASDRMGRRPALALALALQAGAFIGFAVGGDLAALYAASLVFGFSYGAGSTLFPAMVTDFFGREQAGSLVGILFAMAGSMAAWGPLGAGWIYDRHGSYEPAFWLAAGLNLLALAFLALARSPGPSPAVGASRAS
jgi:MFS family permease